ncbi:MAG: hypothetical protein KDB03_00225 [Planctomycetales bacterium]|nr:hypothetical protein [Planctomycetales bacterium]
MLSRLTRALVPCNLTVVASCFAAWLICVHLPRVSAQEELPLIDQQPFDLITVKAAAGGGSAKVLPLPFPGRVVPTNNKETDRLTVVITRFPEREYEIVWRDIERIDLYERMIYDQALAKLAEKEFITAFQNLSFLMRNYAHMPGLEKLRRDFLLRSATSMFGDGRLQQTLSTLEELRNTAPDYEATSVTAGISNATERLVRAYQQQGDQASAVSLLLRIENAYGATMPVIARWKSQVKQQALDKQKEAQEFFEQQRYRESRRAAIEMLGLDPNLTEGQELLTKITETYPMTRVGVMQRATEFDAKSLVNWPARRVGSLVQMPLIRFLKVGSEGGRYGFALGPTPRFSDDRQQLIFSLDPSLEQPLSAFQIGQSLLARATPGDPLYDPSWSAILKNVSTPNANQVIVNLYRPNVLPHALMQWPLEELDPGMTGEYELSASEERESSFRLRGKPGFESQPREIVEVFYDDPKEAINDLLKGDIDVLDQLFPADAMRLASDSRVQVMSYALPSVHMLIPVSDEAYLQKDKFRRALLYATNREEILRGELLGSTLESNGRLVSGPFPIGEGSADPLAYAYDPSVAPTPYNPHLAKLLIVMVEGELAQAAKKAKQPVPEMRPLIVGCPDFEFARVAVQALIQQWSIVGIQAEMRVLPAGKVAADNMDVDLVYLMTTMWEPATDVERLLGGNGIARSDNPFVVQALERLRSSLGWREVRDSMQEIHRLIDFHLPVIPLWQVKDRFAIRKNVSGVEPETVSLYQNISQWRVQLNAAAP